MTVLAKIPSKGVAVLQSVASVYVAMQAMNSVEVSGRKTETTDATALDGPVTKQKMGTGYAEPAVLKLTGFYNPSHATYTAFEALMLAPTPTNFKVTWTDSAPTSQIFNGVGFGIDTKGETGKAVMATLEIETSGDPT